MLNSTFSLTGKQFNLIKSLRPENFLVTKPAHSVDVGDTLLDKQARDEIPCRHRLGVIEIGSLQDIS